MGIIKDFLNFRKIKYSPVFSLRGDYAVNGSMDDSDIIGSITDCIGRNCGKLNAQYIRNDAKGLTVKNDYLAKMLSLRWAPELSSYDAQYKMAANLVRHSNAFAVIFYTEDFTRIKSIVPVEVSDFRIWEAADGVNLIKFTWEYDGKDYTLPYDAVIHIRARFDRKRFIGTRPDDSLKDSLELLDCTGKAIRNAVKNSANLKGYLQYNNFADEEEIKKKVKEFQASYMSSSNEGGVAGLDNTMTFHEITQRTATIPTVQAQFLRDNIYRYYGVNENILKSDFTEAQWNAFYEAVIEPIALQLSQEFTYKLLTARERDYGNRIIFTANRLQYATLQARASIGSILFDKGCITINEFRELLYYEPIEGGDVRMVSLNYVKADDQSLYQTGKEDTGGADPPEEGGQNARVPPAMMAERIYIQTRKKGVA